MVQLMATEPGSRKDCHDSRRLSSSRKFVDVEGIVDKTGGHHVNVVEWERVVIDVALVGKNY